MVSVRGKKEKMEFPESFASRFRTADSAALKVALYVMMNGPSDESDIAAALGIPEASVQRSLDYWNDSGLFGDSPEPEIMKDSVPLKKVRRHMSHNEIAVALNGNKEYAVLLQESQKLLGRELSVSESRLLIETVTENGITVPALLMLESYWLETEKVKNVLNRTARTARTWSDQGIRTLEEAEAELGRMEESYHRAEETAAVLKTEVSGFTAKDRRLIDTIYEKYRYDGSFISEVLARNPEANLPYISAVLKDWHKKGYRTISDVRLNSLSSSAAPAVSADTKDSDSLFRRAIRKINEAK